MLTKKVMLRISNGDSPNKCMLPYGQIHLSHSNSTKHNENFEHFDPFEYYENQEQYK